MKSISLRGRFNAGDGREGEAPAEPTPRRNVMFFAAPGWLIAGAVILTITMPLRAQDEPRQY